MGVALAKRKASLDIIRIIALGLVLLIHCVETTWDITPAGLSSLSMPMRLFVLTLYNLGRLSVPLFLFLTGYLMLGREYKSNDIYKFYKTKVFHLVTITWIWTTVYYFIGVATGDHQFSLTGLAKYILFLNSTWAAPHIWYMSMIIGIYLFIPFVSNALQEMDKRVLIVLMSLMILYTFLAPTLGTAMLATDRAPLTGRLDMSYSGGIYGVLMIVGYLVKRYWSRLKNLKILCPITIAIAGLIATIAWHYLIAVVWGYKYYTWYNSFFLLISASAAFVALLKILDKVPPRQYLYSSATAVMGCYLVHYVFIILFDNVWHCFGIGSDLLYFAIRMIFTAVLTALAVFVLRKFPRLACQLGLRM